MEMTYEELYKATAFIRERMAQQDWAEYAFPQIDRERIIREINERMIRYRNMSDFSECRSANAEEREDDDETSKTT